MPQAIVLIGNSITAEVLFSYLHSDPRYTVVATAVDDGYVENGSFTRVPCVGFSRLCEDFPPTTHQVMMAAGYGNLNRTREMLFDRIKTLGYTLVSYIHPQAKVYNDFLIGEGSVILPNAVVEPNSSVGKNSVIWCNTTIAHHSVVGDHCWIAAGAVVSGQATIGSNCFVGVNATIVNDVEVGEHSIIGAATLVSKCVKPNSVLLARSGEPFRYSAEEYVKYFGV